jgi:hypothetical protein
MSRLARFLLVVGVLFSLTAVDITAFNTFPRSSLGLKGLNKRHVIGKVPSVNQHVTKQTLHTTSSSSALHFSSLSDLSIIRPVTSALSLQNNVATVDPPTHSVPPPTQQELKSQPSSAKTLKKLFPLGAMLFFILFNYTILRDTKDVLVVCAPGGGAEIIPFLKTYVNLPSAVGFTFLYSYLCSQMSSEKVFYVLISSFLAFFGAFAGVICA